MVGDQDLRHLAVLPSLKSLNLSDVEVTEAGLAELASLKSLEELAIADEMVTAARLQSLRALKRLKALHILRYGAVTDAGLAELPLLESLEEREITGDAISQAGQQLLDVLKELRMVQYGSYDESKRLTTLALDRGDAIFALESEVDDFRRELDALRQSNPGIVIDSDPKWFDETRGEKRREPPSWDPGF